jgi:uncharacterized protein (DUF2336 family)
MAQQQPNGPGRIVIAILKRLFSRPALPSRLSYEEARSVLESQESALQEKLARHPDAEPEMLYYLASRGTPEVRRAVAAHPATPAMANRALADDVDADVRAELAQKIGRLLPDLLASERERVCELTLETLDRLAQDQLPRVRALLAQEIKSLTCVPKHIVDGLARDIETMVSAPILEFSPLLSDNDLLEIVASARAPNVLSAVAKRRGVSADVSQAIVAALDVPAVAALLANPDARIREDTIESLLDRAESIDAWHGPLVMRSDLSVRAVRRIAGFVGASLLEMLAGRHGLDDETQAILKRNLRQRVERDLRQQGEDDRARAAVAAAHAEGKLDEHWIEAALDAGQRELVAEALAFLAQCPRAVIDKIVASRSAKAVTAIVWRAKLPMRTAFKIQTSLLRLMGADLLPARAGHAFPLSEEEMRWHLSYFGLS